MSQSFLSRIDCRQTSDPALRLKKIGESNNESSRGNKIDASQSCLGLGGQS
mgnify:CR=1 FL=1